MRVGLAAPDLLCRASQTEVPGAQCAEVPAPSSRGGNRLLGPPSAVIVDDDPIQAMRTRLLPAVATLWPVVTRTGEASRSLVRVICPRVVIVAVGANPIPARRTVADLRRDGFTGPLVATTAHLSPSSERGSRESGATVVLRSPLNNLLLRDFLVRVGVLRDRESLAWTLHSDIFALGECLVDLRRGVIRRDNMEFPLTVMQRQLLDILVRHRGDVVSRETLTGLLWPDGSVERGRLDRHVSAIRRALGEPAQEPRHLLTVRDVGFRVDGAAWQGGAV